MSDRWSFLVFMTAPPRLATSAKDTLRRLCEAGASSSVTIAAHVDTPGGKPARYRIEQGKAVRVPWSKTAPYVAKDALCDFIDWGTSAGGKDSRTALVMWGEGGGWIYPAGLYADGAGKPIDQELHDAIAKSSPCRVDVLGFDACVMSMIEIVYGVRDVCAAHVASETYVPLAGWSYEKILEIVDKKPKIKPIAYGEKIVPTIRASRQSATLTAVDAPRAQDVAIAIRELAEVLMDLPAAGKGAVVRARADMLHVGNPLFVDMMSMFKALARRVDDKAVSRATEIARRAVGKAILANAGSGKDNGAMKGLSIFFPQLKSRFLPAYHQLHFAKDTHWGTFLDDFVVVAATH